MPLSRDLGLSATDIGFAAGIVFAGYITVPVPGNLIQYRIGARTWITGSPVRGPDAAPLACRPGIGNHRVDQLDRLGLYSPVSGQHHGRIRDEAGTCRRRDRGRLRDQGAAAGKSPR